MPSIARLADEYSAANGWNEFCKKFYWQTWLGMMIDRVQAQATERNRFREELKPCCQPFFDCEAERLTHEALGTLVQNTMNSHQIKS